MAGNIYGYQGVHTPLESVTQGRYTLSDYTNMRTELTARLIALENQGGFVPTNVEITGYLHMLPGGSGTGEIETTSSITGATLYINGEAHCGNLVCDNTAVFGGNLTVNGGSILTGNGSGLTNINDITKLPLSGGTLTNSLTITAPGKYIGDGSLLTGIAASDPTKVPLAGGTMTGSLTLTAPAKFIGDGSLLTGVVATDATKLPLAGGTMSGTINAFDVKFVAGKSALNYKLNLYSSFANTVGPLTFTPVQQNSSVHDYIRLEFNDPCTVNLANLSITSSAYYQDKMRLITITKRGMASGDYAVTVLPPTGYVFHSPTLDGVATYSIPLTKFSVTFMVAVNGAAFTVDVISIV